MSDSGLPPPPPPGLNYLAVIEPAVGFCLLGAFFGGLLLPLFVFLFLFSKPQTRRYPVFILNVVIVTLGLTLAILNTVEQWKNLVTPTIPVPQSLTEANIVFAIYSPMIIDSVLLFRLLAFFPRMTTPRHTFFKVLALPVLVKCARFTLVTLFLVRIGGTNGDGSITLLATELWFRNPYMTSEWSLQIIDNLYCTTFFFWKLRRFYLGGSNRFLVRNKDLLSRLRGIFAIALANFVFPLFMNIAQLVLIVRDKDYARGTQVLMANMYVSIIGVLFATVWASGNAWGRNNNANDQSAFLTTINEKPGYVGSGTDPRLAGSRTKLVGDRSSPRHYVSYPGSRSESVLADQTRVHIDQVVLTDRKEDNFVSP